MEKLGLNLGFLIVQILNFLIIFITLRAWVYKPLMGMMEKRKQAVARGLEDARVAEEARANAEKEALQILSEAQQKAADVVRAANERAEALAKERIAQAEADAAKAHESKMAEISGERNRMLSELRGQVVTLAIAASQKVIGEALDEQRQRRLLEEFFSGVKAGKLVVLEGEEVAGEGAEVTSALPLTADEQSAISKDLQSRLGGGAGVTFKVNPDLLGGVVVRVGDRVIDGSVAGQLQNLRQTL